ncbi:MAG: hypothetical protein RL336_1809 [Pseudomonadota bacterium]
MVAAETQSFAEASQRLNVTPPALSVAIKNLEEEVGGLLFERRQRRVSLTPEGEYFLPIAKRLLREWDDGLDKLQQRMTLDRGSLTIAAMPSFANSALPVCLASFQQQFPNINLTVRDVVMEDVIDLVERGQVDMGITFRSDRGANTRFQPLFTDRFIAVVPPNHPQACRGEIDLNSMLASPLVTLNRESAARRWVEDAIARHHTLASQRIECMNLATVGAMVAAGVGVSIVPNLCRQPMTAQGAVPLALVDVDISHEVGIHTPTAKPISASTTALISVLKTYFNTVK